MALLTLYVNWGRHKDTKGGERITYLVRNKIIHSYLQTSGEPTSKYLNLG